MGSSRTPRGYPLLRGSPPRVERMPWLVQIHDHRRVVGWGRLPLARLPIDLGPDRALCEGARRQQLIDPHSEVLVEVPRAVIPPGIAPGLGMLRTVDIFEPPLTEPAPGLALARRDVGRSAEHVRIPDVDVLRRDVEIPAEYERLGRFR